MLDMSVGTGEANGNVLLAYTKKTAGWRPQLTFEWVSIANRPSIRPATRAGYKHKQLRDTPSQSGNSNLRKGPAQTENFRRNLWEIWAVAVEVPYLPNNHVT